MAMGSVRLDFVFRVLGFRGQGLGFRGLGFGGRFPGGYPRSLLQKGFRV